MNRLMLAFFLMTSMAGVSRADLVYTFRFSPTTGFVAPGTQTIAIFLDETATAPDVTNLATLGMGTANFSVSSTTAPVVFTSATTGFVDDASLTFGFTDLTVPGVVTFNQTTLTTASLVQGTLGTGDATIASIQLGTFTFDLLEGQTTTLSTLAIGPADFALNDGTIISTIGSASYTITAVPEPTSLALVGMVGVGSLVARYRRRKA
jgi:hypothetical protein